jgi:hypothetical protein
MLAEGVNLAEVKELVGMRTRKLEVAASTQSSTPQNFTLALWELNKVTLTD